MKTTYLQYIEYIFYEPREEEKIPDFGDTSDSLDGDLFLKKSFIQATFGLKIWKVLWGHRSFVCSCWGPQQEHYDDMVLNHPVIPNRRTVTIALMIDGPRGEQQRA